MMRFVALLSCAVASACAGKVVVSDITVGEHKGKLTKASFTERSSIPVSAVVLEGDKPVSEIEMAAVRFTHQSSQQQVWFPLSAGEGNTWSTAIDMVRHAEESFFFKDGEYAVAVVISDPRFTNQVETELGVADMRLVPTPLFRQKLEFGEEKDWVRRKPQSSEIRPAESKASALASTAFCAALGVPVLALFALLFNAGVNFSGLFENKLTFLRSVIFHGCICAICSFIFMYWVSVPLFHTLVLVGGTGAAAFVFRPKPAAPTASKEKED
eukprot:TRINITY_DN10009_c0_g3_i2.p2 TRINITY_DN10009_c0_g3~~TRINITY_DN10009_c0_g3_i2.p2  ORF type:complete len:293 (+),score=109.00 TRINITY_DN10009_c0_g3_i2:72-881(+)